MSALISAQKKRGGGNYALILSYADNSLRLKRKLNIMIVALLQLTKNIAWCLKNM